MAPIDVIGTDGVTLVETRKQWSLPDGHQLVEIYKGPVDKAETFYKSKIWDISLDLVSITRSGGIGTVELTKADNDGTGAGQSTEELNAVWELLGQDIYRDVRSHETFNKDADQAALAKVQRAWQEQHLHAYDASGDGAPATTYKDLLLRNTTEFVRSIAVLQKTVKISRRAAFAPVWNNVDRALKLFGELGSPAPPAEIVGVISLMPDADNTKRQWLKRAPQVRQVGKHTYQVIYHWWFSRRWSAALYSGDAENGNP